jgi:hypothetical protein
VRKSISPAAIPTKTHRLIRIAVVKNKSAIGQSAISPEGTAENSQDVVLGRVIHRDKSRRDD